MFTGSPKGKVFEEREDTIRDLEIRFEIWNLRFTRRMESREAETILRTLDFRSSVPSTQQSKLALSHCRFQSRFNDSSLPDQNAESLPNEQMITPSRSSSLNVPCKPDDLSLWMPLLHFRTSGSSVNPDKTKIVGCVDATGCHWMPLDANGKNVIVIRLVPGRVP
ncbi:hypothetical protein PAAG_12588 [Paracoccidioides lutzii Pb01]|uniref:Uncharacterized protein n=1 Tax=Paracoccidioides lutzii (strain ATCC MYA-826 / Pb01) TaxID=502779 RepID=A0A0A2V3N7_PARBA|nr:hypothetical protein PAAG_12588 [Paracoccidioides lutzii Pb01]KGQ00745.1 hypothetical protein PAAG_12588 [Paracoccidioides lutzii Pb01]